jgi:hypothetical protein
MKKAHTAGTKNPNMLIGLPSTLLPPTLMSNQKSTGRDAIMASQKPGTSKAVEA